MTSEQSSDRGDSLRILDAAANRAREGVRVVEDYVRFALDDAHLTGLLKSARHDLTATLGRIDARQLMTMRETRQDVGTGLTTPAEVRRQTTLDVVQAGFKRVQEATRSLEEYGKLISPTLGHELEQLRYRFYTLEKSVLRTVAARERLANCRLYLLVTGRLCRHGAERVIRDAIAAGVDLIQIREKSMPDRELVDFGRQVRQWTREAGRLFIMNDRPDLAVLTDADGVHVGQDELTVHQVRRIIGPNRLVGVSTHSIEQARTAVLDGADYLGIGPVFPSPTKQFDDFVGLELIRAVAVEISLPWFAIGGIDAENLGDVLTAGALRVAVSGAVCAADDPRRAGLELTNAFGG